MVHKVFWDEPYRSELETIVTGVEGNTVAVSETIFFAFSGGQESDAGTIGGVPVLEARTDGAQIVYELGDGHGLRAGDRVVIAVDPVRRYRLMRLHFAAEIVLELVYRAVEGVEKVGAHIGEHRARIDFAMPGSLSPLLPELHRQASAIIEADHPITSAFSDKAAGQRYWEIAGFARVPCGGTHLRRTGEVGAITLKRKNPGRGVERIEITLDAP